MYDTSIFYLEMVAQRKIVAIDVILLRIKLVKLPS